LHDILSDSRRQIAQKIHEHAVLHNIKPQRCSYYFRVEYKRKGKRVFQADLGQANQLLIDPVVDIYDQEMFDEGADPGFKAFILKHITNRCNGCSPNCRKRYELKMIFGKKMIVCVLKITDPTVDELPHLYKLFKIAKEKTTNDL